MRERGQVAAGAQRAARRHPRVDARGEQRQQQLDRLPPNARGAGGQRVGAQQDRRAHDLGRERLADAAGVAAQQVELQPRDLVMRDRDVDEPAEAGVHPVGRRARLDGPLDQRARRRDPLDRRSPSRTVARPSATLSTSSMARPSRSARSRSPRARQSTRAVQESARRPLMRLGTSAHDLRDLAHGCRGPAARRRSPPRRAGAGDRLWTDSAGWSGGGPGSPSWWASTSTSTRAARTRCSTASSPPTAARSCPSPTPTSDLVYANFVVEHLERPGAAFAEWRAGVEARRSADRDHHQHRQPADAGGAPAAPARAGRGQASRRGRRQSATCSPPSTGRTRPTRWTPRSAGAGSHRSRSASSSTLHRYAGGHRGCARLLRGAERALPDRRRSTIVAEYRATRTRR